MFRITLTAATLLLMAACTPPKSERKTEEDFTDDELEKHYELKSKGLEAVLGPSYEMEGHALIPFDVGGAVDMYYYTHAISGTGFATKELIQPDGTGPVPNRTGTYELVAFTKLPYSSDTTTTDPFNLVERRMCGTFTDIGNYSFEAKLEPGETIEIPSDDGATRCIVLDEYKPDNKEFFIGDQKHGLLLVIEIFRDEMEFAMAEGSAELFKKLKAKGYYPYSDLDRPSVIQAP